MAIISFLWEQGNRQTSKFQFTVNRRRLVGSLVEMNRKPIGCTLLTAIPKMSSLKSGRSVTTRELLAREPGDVMLSRCKMTELQEQD